MYIKIKLIKQLLLLLIYWFCTINILGQTTAQISIPFEVYDNAGGQQTLYFGLDQTATDGIDINLGENELPPYPPTGAFDARFLLPENNFSGSLSSWKDYRFASSYPFSGTSEHRLRYQSASGATSLFFSWNLPSEVTGLLQDLVNGTLVNVPLNASGIYELTNFAALNQMKLFIYYNNVVTGFESENIKPIKFTLEQNYPNPFNPATIIKYSIAQNSFVNLSIYNLLGEKVVELVNEVLSVGEYQTNFNASHLSSGVYVAKLISGNYIQFIKMTLVK